MRQSRCRAFSHDLSEAQCCGLRHDHEDAGRDSRETVRFLSSEGISQRPTSSPRSCRAKWRSSSRSVPSDDRIACRRRSSGRRVGPGVSRRSGRHCSLIRPVTRCPAWISSESGATWRSGCPAEGTIGRQRAAQLARSWTGHPGNRLHSRGHGCGADSRGVPSRTVRVALPAGGRWSPQRGTQTAKSPRIHLKSTPGIS